MKSTLKILTRNLSIMGLLTAPVLLVSCYATPVAPGFGPRAAFVPGAGVVVPNQRVVGGGFNRGLAVLPNNCRRVVYRGNPYWMNGNTCYAQRGGRYFAVPRPW